MEVDGNNMPQLKVNIFGDLLQMVIFIIEHQLLIGLSNQVIWIQLLLIMMVSYMELKVLMYIKELDNKIHGQILIMELIMYKLIQQVNI